MAATLDMAVKLTESATFPLARLVKKLETFPPGQAATRNIPKAMLGGGLSSVTNTQVRKGNTKNWENIPITNPFGFWTRY
jgi:hypothetical protein